VLAALAVRYQGLFLILERAVKAFKVVVSTQQEWISVDRLKLHVGAGPVQRQEPPKRGQPRAPKVAIKAAVLPTQAARLQSMWVGIV